MEGNQAITYRPAETYKQINHLKIHSVTVIKLTTPVTVHLWSPCTSTNTDFTLFAITKCSKTHKSYIKTHLSTGSSRITLSPKCVIYKANKQLFASWSDQKHYKQHKTVSKSFIHVHLSQISIRTKTRTTDSKRKHQYLKLAKFLKALENLAHRSREHLRTENRKRFSAITYIAGIGVLRTQKTKKGEPRSRISPSFPSHKPQS